MGMPSTTLPLLINGAVWAITCVSCAKVSVVTTVAMPRSEDAILVDTSRSASGTKVLPAKSSCNSSSLDRHFSIELLVELSAVKSGGCACCSNGFIHETSFAGVSLSGDDWSTLDRLSSLLSYSMPSAG